jgi:hypothetical protein
VVGYPFTRAIMDNQIQLYRDGTAFLLDCDLNVLKGIDKRLRQRYQEGYEKGYRLRQSDLVEDLAGHSSLAILSGPGGGRLRERTLIIRTVERHGLCVRVSTTTRGISEVMISEIFDITKFNSRSKKHDYKLFRETWAS